MESYKMFNQNQREKISGKTVANIVYINLNVAMIIWFANWLYQLKARDCQSRKNKTKTINKTKTNKDLTIHHL